MRTGVLISYILLIANMAVGTFVLIPINLNLLLTVFLCIYIGSHMSLSEVDLESQMKANDAYWFPVMGSCTLLGLYICFKFLNKEYVNYVLAGYFFCIGVYSLTAGISPVIQSLISKSSKPHYIIDFKWKFWWEEENYLVQLTLADIIALVVSIVFGAWYLKTKHWLGNNIFGIAFSIQGIASLSLGSYKVGAILLVGLFFYDIFWVFGTDVMVTVATSFDAPIKLLFPRALATTDSDAVFSMLGLGDIVIPGIFIALLLRFDASRVSPVKTLKSTSSSEIKDNSAAVSEKETSIPDSFVKTYFNAVLISYILGLVATLLVMYYFQHAQPALLYLVPACLIGSMGCAVIRGEVKELWNYDEEIQSSTVEDAETHAKKE